jgi:hypothetical protein
MGKQGVQIGKEGSVGGAEGNRARLGDQILSGLSADDLAGVLQQQNQMQRVSREWFEIIMEIERLRRIVFRMDQERTYANAFSGTEDS